MIFWSPALTLVGAFMNLTQTTCNGGVGRLTYECIRGHQMQGFDDDSFRGSEDPKEVLSSCVKLCTSDRTSSNQLVRACKSFDFLPGRANPLPSDSKRFDDSKCFLSRDLPQPEGIGVLAADPQANLFVEICLSSSRVEKGCPNRLYVFDLMPRKHFKLNTGVIEIPNLNKTQCQDRCLNEFNPTCRSATYMYTTRTCILNRFTFRTHPEFMSDNADSVYMENTCLTSDKRCEGQLVFIMEDGWELGGPFDLEVHTNIDRDDCLAKCLLHEEIYCRSVEYNNETRSCVLSDEDSQSQQKEMRQSSRGNAYYELMCLDGARSTTIADNTLDKTSGTSHLFSDGHRRDILTAFKRYRNSRLRADCQSEIQYLSLAECLDECLKQTSYQCLSVMFRERGGRCVLCQYDQRAGYRLQYDLDHDYYENLIANPLNAGYPPSGDKRPPGLDRPGDKFGPQGPNRPHDIRPHDNRPHDNRPHDNRPHDDDRYQGSSYGGSSSSHGSYGGHYGGSNQFGGSNQYGGGGQVGGGHYGGSSYGGPSSVGHHGGGQYGGGSSHFGSHGGSGSHGFYDGNQVGSGYNDRFRPGYPASNGYGGGTAGYGGNALRPGTAFTGCNDASKYRQTGARQRMRRPYIRRYLTVENVFQCERECSEARDFSCRSFNFRLQTPGGYNDRDNCELSDRDTRELDLRNPTYFETNGDFDFYERQAAADECLDVAQTCSDEGMEFRVRMPEGFRGRIYANGFFDRCFVRGSGDPNVILRLPGPTGYPDCGTARYGDTLTNVVVVQFSDLVQTGKDKRYNLTCLTRGPGEAVVTSGYIGSGSGSPTPIEYLPAENTLSSRVRLMILYQGRPTTTIAVGDPLVFKLESQEGGNYISDLFATNVIAKDPYSGRAVQLIDRYGCPVDYYVFPALDRAREGEGLEARFYAFKIPESNFLVFEATVRSCRGGCQPAYCPGPAGREEASFGRKKRAADDSDSEEGTNGTVGEEVPATVTEDADEEHVREMIQVYGSRLDMPEEVIRITPQEVCLSPTEYYGLVAALICVLLLMILFTLLAGYCYRRYRLIQFKNYVADSSGPQQRYFGTIASTSTPPARQPNFFLGPELQKSLDPRYVGEPRASEGQSVAMVAPESPLVTQGRRRFEDPSEPIYTDPSLFERSRSLRSISVSESGQTRKKENNE